MQAVRSSQASTFAMRDTKFLYRQTVEAVRRKDIHPMKAFNLIETAISNGHMAPEILPSSRRHLAAMIGWCIENRHCDIAVDQISRCLARKHVTEISLMQSVSDIYLNWLLDSPVSRIMDTDGLLKNTFDLDKINRAVKFAKHMNEDGSGATIQGRTYDRLLKCLREHSRNEDASAILKLAMANNVTLCTSSWNIGLQEAARKSPESVLLYFQEMTFKNITPDKYSISILLKTFRTDVKYKAYSEKVIAVAKHLNIYNEYTAVEEMSLLKKQYRFQDVLNVFAERFGSDVLKHFGLLHPPGDSASLIHEPFPLTKQALSLAIDALVRINSSPKSLKRLYEDYLAFIKHRPELKHDIYTLSVFVGAFAMRPSTLERTIEILDRMRRTDHKPNVVSYTSVIHGLTKQGMTDLATRVLQYMQNDQVQPNSKTLRILKKGYEDAQDYESAYSCEETMNRLQSRSNASMNQ